MKSSEAKKIVAFLAASFPGQIAKLGETAARQMAEVYAEMLADLEYDHALAAVRRLATTARWLPTIAEIREVATDLALGPRRHGGDAWGDVLSAVSRHGRNRYPQFEDAITAACVRALGWQEICNSENAIADRARFIELYDKLAREKRTDEVAGEVGALTLPSGRKPQGLGVAIAALGVLEGGRE